MDVQRDLENILYPYLGDILQPWCREPRFQLGLGLGPGVL